MKLTEEQLAALSPEQRKAYEDGNAIAVKVYQPVLSNRMFTVAAAILVGMLLAPIWVPISGLMYAGMGIAALLWMVLFKAASNIVCKLRTQLEIEKGMTNFIRDAIQKTLEKQGLNAYDNEGTNPSDTCLNKEDGGSDEVQ
jgi:hypothetical protein